MVPSSLTPALKQEAARLGFDTVGICPAVSAPGVSRLKDWLESGFAGEMHYLADRADSYAHPSSILEDVQSILMLALVYRGTEPSPVSPGYGRVSQYAWGTDYHDVIRERLHHLADFHRRLRPDAGVRGVVDTAPLLEREYAQLAGLGWVGKNTMLLNRGLGSWFFLAALLTTEPLDYDEPFQTNHCGTCRACLEACPTGALVDAYQLDARKCISYLTIELKTPVPRELRAAMGDWLFGCDICQEVCPWNRRVPTTRNPAFQPIAGMNPVALAELFELNDASFRKRFRGTPLWRPKRRGLLRNAATVLGNRPHPSGLPGLLGGINDPEALVRGACAWALGHYPGPEAIGSLRSRLELENDSEVRAEIQSSLDALHGTAS